MSLSYNLRLICLVVVMTGLLQTVLELTLWISAPLILRLLTSLPIRRSERLLYGLQLTPLLTALLVTGSLFVPQYLRNETNFEAEHVGWLCLLLASAVSVWFGCAALRGLRVAARTMRFITACKRTGCKVQSIHKGFPVLALPGETHCVALVGLFNPFILISGDMIENGGFTSVALEVALDHERSHARQLDNWKLLLLYFLPGLSLRLPGGSTWMQLWQSTAEWAADDDAVRGDSARAFLLAEALVAVARPAAPCHPAMVLTTLASGTADLGTRIDRLIYPRFGSRSPRYRSILLALSAMAFGVAGAIASLILCAHSLSEHLLHLG